MIKWCGYCLRFLREFEPYDQFEISHGICPDCLPKVLTLKPSDRERLQPLRAFFGSLYQRVRSGQVADVATILEDSRRLGIRPLDLMMGVLQPMLAEIGEQWARGEVTAGTEHRFSDLARDLTTHCRSLAVPAAPGQPPALLLFVAPENAHNLGLQMAELYFAISGIPALVWPSELPLEGVLGLIRLHAPKAVGFSVALPDQMAQVLAAAEAIRRLPEPPGHILVGGPAVRLGLAVDPASGLQACLDLSEVMAFL